MNDESKKSQIQKCLFGILSNSTFHGFSKIFTTSFPLRIFWSILFVTSFACCSSIIYQTFLNFFSYETVTSVQVQQEQDAVEFPSISFCSLDAYKQVEELVNLPAFEVSSTIQPEQFAGVMSSALFASENVKYLYSSLYAALDESTRDKAYTPLNETILVCLYNFYLCSSSEFTRYLDVKYGPCLKYTPSKQMTKTGNLNGLRVDLLLNPLESLLFGSDRGLRLVIKGPKEHINANDGIYIKSGQKNGIQVSRIVRKDLPEPYTSCVSDQSDYPSELYQHIVKSSDYAYNQDYCKELCVQKNAIRICDCHGGNMPSFGSNRTCDTLSDIICYSGVYNQVYLNLTKYCGDQCPKECTSTQYDVSISSADFINENYMNAILENPFLKEKYPNMTKSALATRLISFEVFYTSLEYTMISQSPRYLFIDLVSSLGGTLGVFLGASLLSLMEVIEFFIAACMIMTRRKDKLKPMA